VIDMSQTKMTLHVPSGGKRRKRKNPLVAHRKSTEFKEFVKLLRESHARVLTKTTEETKLQTVSMI
jgi:hypothetical protein